MAKISARGASEVARLNFTQTFEDGGSVTGILLLRSDGRILSRLTGNTSTGYRVLGTLKDRSNLDANILRVLARKLGYNVTKTSF